MPLRILHPPKPARAFHGFIAKRPAKTLASQCIRLVSPEDHLSANTHTTQMKVRTKSLTINIKLIALQVGFAINKCRLLIYFFRIYRFQKLLHEHVQTVKHFGPRSGPRFARSDLGPKCLQRLSADETSIQRVKRVCCQQKCRGGSRML